MRKNLYFPATAMVAALCAPYGLSAQEAGSDQPSATIGQDANLSTDLSASQADDSAGLSADANARSSTELGSGNNQSQTDLQSETNLDARTNLGAQSDSTTQSNLDSQTDLNAQGDTNLNAQSDNNLVVPGNPQSATNQSTLRGQANLNSQPQNNAGASGNESWRYREFQGRQWYWQGDPQTGSWMYFDNNTWVPFTQGTSAAVNSTGQMRSSGYRGTVGQYDGPYYFDNSGRRYLLQGDSYIQDQNWNNRVWNDNYSNSYQSYWNEYGRNRNNVNASGSFGVDGALNSSGIYGPNGNTLPGNVGISGQGGASVGGAIGQALGGQSGGRVGAGVGAAIEGGAARGQNIGGAVGEAVGGQAGGRVGAAIGGAIDRGN